MYSKYIILSDKSLLFHERSIRRKGLGEEIADSIISSNKGISIDSVYDAMISDLIDEFPILGWRTYLLNCLIDEIEDKKNSAAMNKTTAPQRLYYYGLPG